MAERTFPAEVAAVAVGAVAADAAIKLLSRIMAWAAAHLPPEVWPLILQSLGLG